MLPEPATITHVTEVIPMPIAQRRTFLRAAFTLISAFLMTLALSTSAQAHYVYKSDETWSNTDSSKCTYQRSEISHGNGGGYAKSTVTASDDWGFPPDCIWQWERPIGYLIARYDLYKWNATYGTWDRCRYTNWYRTTTVASRFWVYKNYGTTPPCGKGYYGTVATGATYYSGQWYGAYGIWSGYHYIG